MADARTVASWTFHVLAEVETGHRWNDCSYDPIGGGMSVGIVQEYAYNIKPLANLINDTCPDVWNQMPEPVRSEALTRDDDSWPGWRWPDECFQAMRNILDSDCGRQCQIQRFCSLYNGEYTNAMNNYYFSDDKAWVYGMTIYHQSPQAFYQVAKACSNSYGSCTFEGMYECAANNGIVGDYMNRQNTVHDMLSGWDGTSMPPDGCDVGDCAGSGNTNVGSGGDSSTGGGTDPNHGNNNDQNNQTPGNNSAQITHLLQVGNDLYAFGNGVPGNASFVKGHGQMWLNKGGWVLTGTGGNSNNPSNNGPNSSNGSFTGNGNSNCGAVDFSLQEGILEAFSYVSGGPRTLQGCIEAGGTDCSGWVCIAFKEARNVDIGWSTADQAVSETQEDIWEGTSWDDVPWDQLQCGDIIYMCHHEGPTFVGGNDEHAAIYTGQAPGEVISAGSSPLPKLQDTRYYELGYIKIRRVWGGEGSNGNDAGGITQNLCLDQYAEDFAEGYPDTFTIHSTGDQDLTAQEWADNYCSRSNYTMVHFFCDDKECIQLLSLNKRAIHAFEPANSTSLSLEICEFSNYDRAMASINNSAKHVANILNSLGWGVDRLRTHKYWSDNFQGDHQDPDNWFQTINFSFDYFKMKVQGYM